jgi:5-hydroxyisourate hydrolase
LGRLTTHVLNTADGVPAASMVVELFRGGERLCETKTNADGRCDAPLLEGDAFTPGVYTLSFHAAAYFHNRGARQTEPAFLDVIDITVGLTGEGNVHIPLLVSPWSYATYRGS